jgi:hypothetical protein
LVVTALAAVSVAMVPAFATSLGGLTPGTAGARGVAVTACDTNGFTMSYATSGSNVTSATVGGIADPGCEGGQLSLILANGTTSLAAGGPATVPTDAGTTDSAVTVTLSPQPAAAQVNRVHVSITGP